MMKKIFTLLCFASLSFTSFGQAIIPGFGGTNVINQETFFPKISAAAAEPNDTLGLTEFLTSTPSLFGLPTGFATGFSNSIDTFDVGGQQIIATTQFHAFSEGHIVNGDYSVVGAMFFAGSVSSVSGTNPNITVSAQLIEDSMAISNPATIQSPDIEGPGQTLASATVPLEDVGYDPLGNLIPTFVNFPSAPFVDSDMCVTVNIENVYAGSPMDTIAIISTNDGEGDGTWTYHRLSQSAVGFPATALWTPTSVMIQSPSGSAIDINLAIFPIVSEPNGIEDAGFFSGLKMTTYPNPALAIDNVTIQYGLETGADKVEINIFDMNGKVVFSTTEGSKANGLYNVNVPIGTLNAGSYVYALEADGARIAKRMEVLK